MTFRPLVASDLAMLHEWIHRPHVAQWWAHPSTLEALEADYLSPAAAQSSTRAYIAMLDDAPLGFVQVYVAVGAGGGWWEDERDPGVRGIDQFLADAGRLGQGLGSAMVRAFVGQIFGDPAVSKVQTDPDPRNLRAIRSYAKAGFRAVREVATPDGAALLMICDRPGKVSRGIDRGGAA